MLHSYSGEVPFIKKSVLVHKASAPSEKQDVTKYRKSTVGKFS